MSKRWQQENRARFAEYMRDYRAGKRRTGRPTKSAQVVIQFRNDSQITTWRCPCGGGWKYDPENPHAQPACAACNATPMWATKDDAA